MKRIFSFTLFIGALLFATITNAQNDQGIVDGASTPTCTECNRIMNSVPKEIDYGIIVQHDSVVFFITSLNWFNKIFIDNSYGIIADIVSKDQFKCGAKKIENNSWHMGTFIKPVYLSELKKRQEKSQNGNIHIYLGKVPDELKGKELEGNFVLVRNDKSCYINHTVHIDNNLWELLDMGLYTDSLLQMEKTTATKVVAAKKLYFTEKKAVTIPYAKGDAKYTPEDIKRLYKIMNLKGYKIMKINIRAFSSVEGELVNNIELQKKRAENIEKAIQSYQKEEINTEVVTGENWVEFMQSIERPPFSYLSNLSKVEIKQKLEKKSLLDSLEPKLSKQRKAVVTVYLVPQSEVDDINDESIIDSIHASIKDKKVDKSVRILRAIFEKVADNKIPSDYLDKIEIPEEKEFSRLLNDFQVYRYMLGVQQDFDALAELKKIKKIEPTNGKIEYNICALQMHVWEYDEKFMNKDLFLQQISNLKNLGIANPLIKRMLINYNIMLSEIYMKQENFAAKDRMLAEIKKNYINKDLNDHDLLAIGQYFSYYSLYDWADEILKHRIDKLDVNEDLLFFYLNLSIIRDVKFTEGTNKNMLLNAMSINNKRFCKFFNSTDNGGVSMQLLAEPFWQKTYCDNCK